MGFDVAAAVRKHEKELSSFRGHPSDSDHLHTEYPGKCTGDNPPDAEREHIFVGYDKKAKKDVCSCGSTWVTRITVDVRSLTKEKESDDPLDQSENAGKIRELRERVLHLADVVQKRVSSDPRDGEFFKRLRASELDLRDMWQLLLKHDQTAITWLAGTGALDIVRNPQHEQLLGDKPTDED